MALSGGGDGRIVGECLDRYRDEHPDARFHAVITANGFEDEQAHLQAAAGIADRYHIPYPDRRGRFRRVPASHWAATRR